jgi:hypothetical protein
MNAAIVEVTGIEKMDDVGRISLIGPTETIYNNQLYLKIPWEQVKGMAIGDKYEIRKVE